MKYEEKEDKTKHKAEFLATLIQGSRDQILLNVPKELVHHFNMEKRDIVYIHLETTGYKNARKLPTNKRKQ